MAVAHKQRGVFRPERSTRHLPASALQLERVVLKIEGFQHGMQEKLKSTYMANAVRARGAKCRHAVEKRRGECCACTRS